jgi:hypothetical protein
VAGIRVPQYLDAEEINNGYNGQQQPQMAAPGYGTRGGSSSRPGPSIKLPMPEQPPPLAAPPQQQIQPVPIPQPQPQPPGAAPVPIGPAGGAGGGASESPAMAGLSSVASGEGFREGFMREGWGDQGSPSLSIPGNRQLPASSRALAAMVNGRGRAY